MEPNVYYDAPYLDETEHDALDHTGVPGVAGTGSVLSVVYSDRDLPPSGSPVLTVDPLYQSDADGVAIELLNQGTDPGKMRFLQEGLYAITLLSQAFKGNTSGATAFITLQSSGRSWFGEAAADPVNKKADITLSATIPLSANEVVTVGQTTRGADSEGNILIFTIVKIF